MVTLCVCVIDIQPLDGNMLNRSVCSSDVQANS